MDVMEIPVALTSEARHPIDDRVDDDRYSGDSVAPNFIFI